MRMPLLTCLATALVFLACGGLDSATAQTLEELATRPGVTVVSDTATYRVLEPWEVPEGIAPGVSFGFTLDNQCTANGAPNFCCQLAGVDGCQDADGNPINGGPYYARDEDFGQNDLVYTKLYWSEFLPEDMPDNECENFERTNSSALLPRGLPTEAFFLYYKDEGNFGNLCGERGETVMFCRQSSTDSSLPIGGPPPASV